MDTLELCRLCALEKDNLLGIYDTQGLRLTLDVKIKKCLNIEVSEKEHFPKAICLDCYSKLDAFEEFMESTLNAQATLSILYPEKPEVIKGLTLEEDERENSEDEFGENESFIMGSVQSEEMQICKTEFLPSEKTYTDPSPNPDDCNGGLDVDSCGDSSVPSNILSAMENDSSDPLCFIQSQKPQEEPQESIIKRDLEFEDEEKLKWSMKGLECSTWLCSDCSEQFGDIQDLREHHRTEHNQDARYMCSFCAKVFVECQAFLNHVRRHKNSLKYSCEICGKAFSNRKVVETHMLAHSNSRPYECPECGKTFKQQSGLLVHSKCHLPDSVKCKYPCDLCDKRFSTKPNLVTHMRIHSGVRNFTCDQCGKSFIQKGNLDAHLLTHSHDKPFECEICKKRFKTSMQLRKHHSIHTGAKPHQCDVCGRTFREKGTLREHHRIHTGAMPFTCEYCGKAFRFKGILTTHRRQHTGERPYSCLECQHHFTNWPNYNKHMKRRHGINTSRSTRTDKPDTQPQAQQPAVVSPPQQPSAPAPAPAAIYQEIQPADLYANIQTQPLNTLPTYMAYNVYSLSNVTTLDGTTIEIMPRQTITLKETSNALNFHA